LTIIFGNAIVVQCMIIHNFHWKNGKQNNWQNNLQN